MAEAAQLEERRTEIDETIDGLAVYSDKDRARAGCIVTIGDDGEFCLHEGLVERAALRAAPLPGSTGRRRQRRRRRCRPNWKMTSDDSAARPSAPSRQLRKECGFSQLLVDDLKAHRLQITRAHLAADFGVAFDLALYALCVDLFRRLLAITPLRSNCGRPRATPRSSLNDLSGTPADRLIEAHGSALDLDWLELPPAQGFAALAALPADAKQRLFAWCIASCLKPQLAIEDRADPVIEAAGRRLAIPFADYWRPTAANYWGRAKKAHGLAIGREILGDRWARDHADDKKPVLAAALETRVRSGNSSNCIGLEQAARDSAAAWLPPGMAYADGATSAAVSEDPGPTPNSTRIDARRRRSRRRSTSRQPTCPAFLTEDEPAGIALNGAAAPDAHFWNGDRAPAGARSPIFSRPANPQTKSTGRRRHD